MWWNRRFASWMCSRQICSNCVMLSCQCGPKPLRNVSNTLLNLCPEELRQLWRQKGVQPGTSKVYLYRVCVCVYIYICHRNKQQIYNIFFILAVLLLRHTLNLTCFSVSFLDEQVNCSKHSSPAQPICLAQQRWQFVAGGKKDTGQD